MQTVASDEYVSLAQAALIVKIGEWRLRYWLKRDPKFPRGLRAGRIVVKPSAVAEYFRQLDAVQEVTGVVDAEPEEEE